MGFWVYILECADGSYYTGHTDDLGKRLYEHEHNLFRCYTSSRLPVRLAYSSEFREREEALARERQIKGWSRRKKQALIAGDWESLTAYRKRPLGERPAGGGKRRADCGKRSAVRGEPFGFAQDRPVEP